MKYISSKVTLEMLVFSLVVVSVIYMVRNVAFQKKVLVQQ